MRVFLALLAYGVEPKKALVLFVERYIDAGEFEYSARGGDFSLATNHNHLKVLLACGALELVEKTKRRVYRFHPDFVETCNDKNKLIKKLEQVLC